MLLDFVLHHFVVMAGETKINHFCTIGGESADLKQLFSSDFVYVMLVIYYVPIALVLAITVLAQKCRK